MSKQNTAAKGPGRPRLNIRLPQGAFTVEQLYTLNKGITPKFCELTVRNHVKQGLASGLLVKLAKKLETGSVGAPAFRYMLKSRADANARNLAKASVKA